MINDIIVLEILTLYAITAYFTAGGFGGII
jgi:hypothetical protein